MAFIASTLSLQVGFNTAQSTAATQKIYMQTWAVKLASNVDALFALEMLNNLSRAISTFNSVSSLPGLPAYAQQQVGNSTYDVSTEFTTMVNALIAIQTWLKTNIPAGAVSIVNGVLTGTSYTPAQTAGLLVLVNAAIATIS